MDAKRHHVAIGEILNFSAYSFAPAILVTPLGALSVILGAIFASIFLQEKLGSIGKIGCLLSVVGALIVVLHAPEDKEVTSIDELLMYALRPVGSVSVMAIKAFGIALKLTFAGNNQFKHVSTYGFGAVVVVCIITQMNYFNKALEQFSTNVVNPIYFVFFTTATITASAILFQGFNTDDTVNVVSLMCGFLIIFAGVYLLDSIARGAGASEDLCGLQMNGNDESQQLLLNNAALSDSQDPMELDDSNEDIELHYRSR
ncbi:hypothetical protein DFQ30_003438 [Apophysomyces sp. BC1015]|nr:hypothetical protein DFQ30_003438 [Apophysomyces sp. BC1015]KAG0182801.1 hypothetical protein DFQ29_001966 [Apophysomyces sp. BC1021]